jgi:REP element-mobilizing transposase RayT
MASSRRYEADYFTATILEWKFLLTDDRFKDIIVGSLRHMAERKRAMVHAFVIMNNHIHVIWHILHPHTRDEVQWDMLKFTAQTIIRELRGEPEVLQQYYVGARDRKYLVWECNPLAVPLWSENVLMQKLVYLHSNPVRAGLCAYAEDYKYRTASHYVCGEDQF